MGGVEGGRNRWGRLRETRFELKNKFIIGMKYKVWGIWSINISPDVKQKLT